MGAGRNGGLPVPLITGTIVFCLLGFAASCVGLYLRRSKALSRDDSQIWCVSCIIGTVCCWLMWVCTWLHQWNPVVSPIISSHDAHASSEAPAGH